MPKKKDTEKIKAELKQAIAALNHVPTVKACLAVALAMRAGYKVRPESLTEVPLVKWLARQIEIGPVGGVTVTQEMIAEAARKFHDDPYDPWVIQTARGARDRLRDHLLDQLAGMKD